jgi:hypothetical protein
VNASLSAPLPLVGVTPLLGKLVVPGLPWQATVGVAVAAMLLVFVRDLIIENHLHQEVSVLAGRAAPDAPMSQVAQAVSSVRRPRGRRQDVQA